jgi:hypothetical protein
MITGPTIVSLFLISISSFISTPKSLNI